MAKRSRALSRRRARKTARKLPSRRVPAHRTYAPELLANGRRRYEHTAESVASIAADFGVHHYSLIRLAKREGWVRHRRPARTLPPSARLLEEAERATAQDCAASLTLPQRGEGRPPACAQRATADGVGGEVDLIENETPTPDPSPQRGGEESATAPLPNRDAIAAENPPLTATLERLHRAVLAELATVEAMRARLKRTPRQTLEAARTAQTLSNLTEVLRKLTRLQCAAGDANGNAYDDTPADTDEFRDALARRIDAYFEEPPDARADTPADARRMPEA